MKLVEQNFLSPILDQTLYGNHPLDSKFQKFLSTFNFFSEPQITKQKCPQICSTMKFAKQNYHIPILSWSLYGIYPWVWTTNVKSLNKSWAKRRWEQGRIQRGGRWGRYYVGYVQFFGLIDSKQFFNISGRSHRPSED
jgi:hypothetical protein